MKYLTIGLTYVAIGFGITFVFGILIVLASCGSTKPSPTYDEPWTTHGMETATKVVVIEDHKYILYDGYHSGGIIHAESCPCKVKGF